MNNITVNIPIDEYNLLVIEKKITDGGKIKIYSNSGSIWFWTERELEQKIILDNHRLKDENMRLKEIEYKYNDIKKYYDTKHSNFTS